VCNEKQQGGKKGEKKERGEDTNRNSWVRKGRFFLTRGDEQWGEKKEGNTIDLKGGKGKKLKSLFAVGGKK